MTKSVRLVLVAVPLLLSVVLAGCAGTGPDHGVSSLPTSNTTLDKGSAEYMEEYARVVAECMETVDEAKAATKSIVAHGDVFGNASDRRQLFDAGLQIASVESKLQDVSPPENLDAAHAKLLEACKHWGAGIHWLYDMIADPEKYKDRGQSIVERPRIWLEWDLGDEAALEAVQLVREAPLPSLP